MTQIEAKIPFSLLTSCRSNDTIDGVNHMDDCMCHGSGGEPTMLGYEILHLIKWALEYAPWRLCSTSGGEKAYSIATVVEYLHKNELRRVESKYQHKLLPCPSYAMPGHEVIHKETGKRGVVIALARAAGPKCDHEEVTVCFCKERCREYYYCSTKQVCSYQEIEDAYSHDKRLNSED